MSASSSSSSASSSTAVSPKPMPESAPISPPKVIPRRFLTARISTGGRIPKRQLAAPIGQQPAPVAAPEPLPIQRRSQPDPWWNRSSASSSSDSEPEDDSDDDSDPEDDPEDDPDNEFIHKKKRLRRYFSSDLADESDEEELGDQDRKSIDDADPDSYQNQIDGRDYDIASPDGDDSNF